MPKVVLETDLKNVRVFDFWGFLAVGRGCTLGTEGLKGRRLLCRASL